MRKTFSVIALLLCVISCGFLLSSCGDKGVMYDGINLSNVQFSRTTTGTSGETKIFTHKITCVVKNTTEDVLEFRIRYSARYGGILASISHKYEEVTLQAGEKRTIVYEIKNTTLSTLVNREVAIVDVAVVLPS